MKNKKFDMRDIGLRVAYILGRYVLKTEHLHYGYWPENMEVKLENLPKAQELYAEFLLKNIPPGVKSILDVGCGTGHNDELLIAKGYHVDCVSPSAYFAECTCRKLPSDSKIYEGYFENVDIPRRYDLILFSESFQYIKMNVALKKSMEILNPGGYILIADFFRIPGDGVSPMGGGHRLHNFQMQAKENHLSQLKEIDITANTAPNLKLVDDALQEVAIPLRNLFHEIGMSRFRWFYSLGCWIGNLLWRRKIRRFNYKYLSGNRNAENFSKFKTYRLFLLRDDAQANAYRGSAHWQI